MINPKKFYETLVENGINFFTGVPDSTLKGFCKYVSTKDNHLVAANEGSAIGIATGQYLATSKPALVYMQNSGLGNATNPLTSLASEEVYSIPMLLLIGWRGNPGVHDEPQHVLQGKIMLEQLKLLGIECIFLDDIVFESQIIYAVEQMQKYSKPIALISSKIFEDCEIPKVSKNSSLKLTREDAIKCILKNTDESNIFISTTGFTSRELFSLRKDRNEENNDFLTVGSMGHASQIALGVAMNTNKKVICLDGDSAAIMHMGGMASIGSTDIDYLMHIVFNNACHESVGGLPNALANKVTSLSGIATECGYDHAVIVTNKSELKWALQLIGKVFIEIEIKQGYRKDLPRPDATPKENKIKFMDKLTNWKTIWNNKPENETLSLKTLLSLDGFENVGEISIDAWLDYVKHIQEKLNITKEETILEVGCGAGAFLYPLYSQGFNVSGCDYSKSLIANANKAIKSSFVCCNINNYISDVKFNHVISNSVFQYFPDYTYAEKVIQKLITLSKSTISILDVNDLKKVLDATKERPVYPAHTFYSKDWWIELAQKYNLDILIEDQAIENYSNSKFRYNVFLRKV